MWRGRPVRAEADTPPTVEGLFRLIAEAYARGADQVRVRYDERLGYPAEVYVDYEALAADEEASYSIAALTAG